MYINAGDYIEYALDPIKAFLTVHPSETILASFKKEREGDSYFIIADLEEPGVGETFFEIPEVDLACYEKSF